MLTDKYPEHPGREARGVRAIRVVQLTLMAAAVMGGPRPARATVACGPLAEQLGSYTVALDHPVRVGSCDRLDPASIMDARGQRVIRLGDVSPFVEFQLLEDRYLFWDSGSTVYQADLRARTKHAVFESAANRGRFTYTASPGHTRVALVYRGLVSWAAVSSAPSPVDHDLYRWQTPDELLWPVAWSSDDRTFWFCRVQGRPHRVRVVGVSIDGPSFTSASLSGEVPACDPSPLRPQYQAAPGLFSPDGGYFFRYTYEHGPPPVWHLFLHDVPRNRVADLGEIQEPHGAYWKTTPPEIPVFGPDGSCTYVARDGRRRFVADAASLLSPPIERTRNGPLYDAVARAARGISELLEGLR